MATTPAQTPQRVVREARRLLSERGWNPLAGAFNADGDECSPSDPNAVSYSTIGAVYAVIWPRERLLTGQDSDSVIPTDYVASEPRDPASARDAEDRTLPQRAATGYRMDDAAGLRTDRRTNTRRDHGAVRQRSRAGELARVTVRTSRTDAIGQSPSEELPAGRAVQAALEHTGEPRQRVTPRTCATSVQERSPPTPARRPPTHAGSPHPAKHRRHQRCSTTRSSSYTC